MTSFTLRPDTVTHTELYLLFQVRGDRFNVWLRGGGVLRRRLRAAGSARPHRRVAPRGHLQARGEGHAWEDAVRRARGHAGKNAHFSFSEIFTLNTGPTFRCL